MISRLVAAAAVLWAVVVPAQGNGQAVAAAPSPAVQAARPVQHLERLIFRGVTGPLRQMGPVTVRAASRAALPGLEVQRQHRGFRGIDVHPAARSYVSLGAAALRLPAAANRPVLAASADIGVDFFGFAGLSQYDQRNAGDGRYANTQFSLEPPDQGLCAGNGYVMEPINNAVAVYNTLGTRLTAVTPLNQFFGLNPEVERTPPVKYGPFLSDPRCYFDRDSQRWFLTELEFDVDPVTGANGTHSATLIAVSQSPDPTGNYRLYTIDTTDAANTGCPCFGDQPLLGADANGVYISANEFPISGPGFNGDQIYALSKRGLTTGRGSTVVHIDAGKIPPNPGGLWYSIQPAESPDTSVAARMRNGTEFFLSSLDFNGTVDNRIAVWALTNTASLANAAPNVELQHVVLRSNEYGQPPPAVQKAGSTPLGTSLGAPLELIDSGDDRMEQVVYAAGRLWAGLNTAVGSGGVGIAYFAVAPTFSSTGVLAAHIMQQGYIAVAGQNIIYPSIGVNANGGAVMAATLSGPDYFPTAVYITQDGTIHLAGPGAGADDGFTAYAAYGGKGVARWGDYSAAVADVDGSIWTASEYIPGGPRTALANWGTFIGHVQVH